MKIRLSLAEFPVEGWSPSCSGVLRVYDHDGRELGACSLRRTTL